MGQPSKKSGSKKKPTSAAQWKKGGGPTELEVPSGNVCLVRRKALQGFVKSGAIPNSLMPIVTEAISGKKSGKQLEKEYESFVEDLTQDEDSTLNLIDSMMTLVDYVVIECVVEPKVHQVPEDEEDRDEEVLYVDEVDIDDKMFIFNFVIGGTRDLEPFRTGSAPDVEGVRTVAVAED